MQRVSRSEVKGKRFGEPQRIVPMMTGYISSMMEEGESDENSGGHLAENHLPLK